MEDQRADRWADRKVDPKVDRKVGPKVDRMEDQRADRWADRKVGPKVGRWEDRKEVRWGDPRGGRRAVRTVARKVGLVALQAAWVEALVLGLWEPLVAPQLRKPESAAREAGLLRVQRPAVVQLERVRGRGASNQPQGPVPRGGRAVRVRKR